MQEKSGKREAATLKKRKHIVQAAALCFIDQGFHQTSVRDIAKRANISLGNLYNHFENKTALIAEIAALEAEDLAGVTKALSGAAPPEKRMERFIKAYFKAVSGKGNAVLTAEIMAEAMRNPSIAAGYDANRQVLLAALAPLVESLHPGALPTPRAILSRPAHGRNSCSYSIYCGSYGCSTGGKSSARAALLDQAVTTGRCHIRPHARVMRLISDARGKVVAAEYVDRDGNRQRVGGKIFVVACQAIETARLLLSSPGPKHPHGLGNNRGQVGRNLLFSAGGSGQGTFLYRDRRPEEAEALRERGPFVNRGLQDWYVFEAPRLGRVKGGTIDFLFRHPNPVARANPLKRDDAGRLIWGSRLKRRLQQEFTQGRYLRYEVFCDWLPTDDCFVTLDPHVKDKWGMPVARVRVGYHPHDLRVGEALSEKAQRVLREMGARDVYGGVSGSPPTNLVAGGCRFGTDPAHAVLDPDCRVFDAPNLYVSDGSFMPTGGSVPYTWTIYANAFRVGQKIVDAI